MNIFNFELSSAVVGIFLYLFTGFIIGYVLVLVRLFFISHVEKPHYD